MAGIKNHLGNINNHDDDDNDDGGDGDDIVDDESPLKMLDGGGSKDKDQSPPALRSCTDAQRGSPW